MRIRIWCRSHTNVCPGSDEVGLFARFALSRLVECRHSEGVLQALHEAGARVLCGFDHRLVGLHPQQAVSLLLFNAVSGDGIAAVTAGTLPGQDDKVLVDLVDLQVFRLTGRIFRKMNALR